jgi:geranylgeranyl diphosphate synthase type I
MMRADDAVEVRGKRERRERLTVLPPRAGLRSVVDDGLRAVLREIHQAQRALCGQALGIVDAQGVRVEGGGERLRPMLCLRVCQALGGETDRALLAALALECIHTFSLVHDDIADGERERPEGPALWTRAGVGAALAAGNALLVQGMGLAWRAGPREAVLIQGAAATTVAGQHLELSAEWAAASSVADWERLALHRTAALFAAAGAAGAAAAGAGDAAVEIWWHLGERLGLAFQAREDILGVWGDPAAGGREADADQARRLSILPVVAALERGGARVAAAVDDPGVGPAQLLRVFEDAGARQRAAEVEGMHRDAVRDLIAQQVPQTPAGDALRALVSSLWGRRR